MSGLEVPIEDEPPPAIDGRSDWDAPGGHQPSVLGVHTVAFLTWIGVLVMSAVSISLLLAFDIATGAVSAAQVASDRQGVLQRLVDEGARPLLIGVLGTSGLLAMVSLGIAQWRRPRSWSWTQAMKLRLGFERAFPLDLALATGAVIGIAGAIDGLIYFADLRDVGALAKIREALAPLSPVGVLVASVVIGAGPGIGEELFFRGYMLRRLDGVTVRWVALASSSIAFGLFHFDAIHTPSATVMGFVLGFVVLATGSLWTGIVAHTINNMLAAALVKVSLGPLWVAVTAVLGTLLCVGCVGALAQRYPGALDRKPPV